MKLTRRELAAAVQAQSARGASVPPGRPRPEKPPHELEAARESRRRQATALDAFDLPAETEPDFQFKA